MIEVTFTACERGNFEVAADGETMGWLEDAGEWTWLPNRRNRGAAAFDDRTFGRDFEGAKEFITWQIKGSKRV